MTENSRNETLFPRCKQRLEEFPKDFELDHEVSLEDYVLSFELEIA